MKFRRDARAVLAGAVLSLTVAACAGAEDKAGAAGLEPLTVVTAQGQARFLVEIADDEAERQQGLMGRPPLADDRGMLFQFPDAQERSFWMKNTPSSLDIVYLDPAGRVVSIARRTTPFSEAQIWSRGAAKGVLEIRAGRADELGLKPGDRVRHPFFGG